MPLVVKEYVGLGKLLRLLASRARYGEFECLVLGWGRGVREAVGEVGWERVLGVLGEGFRGCGYVFERG